MNRVAKEFMRRRGLNVGLFYSPAEEHLKLRAGSPKFGGRCERQVELQTAGHQEDPINGWSTGQVEQVRRIQPLDELTCPILEHLKDRDAVRDREGQVKVRPAIASAQGE